MADQKLTALSEISVPALEDLYYIVDDPSGTPVSNKITGFRLAGLVTPQVQQGRITTESGVAVSTSDRTAQGTLFWTPCTPQGVATASGLVGFFDGTRYVVLSLTQLSLDLSTAEAGGPIDSGENYDVFLDYNGGTPALVIGPSWTNDTTRATALAQQGPLIVLTGDTDWRWVGTIRASGSGVTADAAVSRFVWNAQNQVPRTMMKQETTNSWTYASATFQQANNSAANQLDFVQGDNSNPIKAWLQAAFDYSANSAAAGIGLTIGIDGITPSSLATGYESHSMSVGIFTSGGTADASIYGYLGLGRHIVTWIENATSTTATFYGDAGGAISGSINSGIFGEIMG